MNSFIKEYPRLASALMGVFVSVIIALVLLIFISEDYYILMFGIIPFVLGLVVTVTYGQIVKNIGFGKAYLISLTTCGLLCLGFPFVASMVEKDFIVNGLVIFFVFLYSIIGGTLFTLLGTLVGFLFRKK